MGKGFTTGLMVGVVMGATFGMLVDPINDKCHKRMNKTKENMFKALGGMLDEMMGR